MSLYLKLFWEFFKVGLFAVGGGMATLPFLKEIGTATGWYTYTELMNMLAVSESTPGPIGINMATYVGFTVGGVPGTVIATLGEVTPSINGKLRQRPDIHGAAVAAHVVMHPQIHRAPQHLIPDVEAILALDGQLDAGCLLAELLQDRLHLIGQQRLRRGHPQGSGQLGILLAVVGQPLHRLQHGVHIGNQLPPRLCDGHFPADLLKQLDVKLILQLLHLECDGGLGIIQLLSRLLKAVAL